MIKLLMLVGPGFGSLKSQLTLYHLGEKARQSQPREYKFVDKSIVHKYWLIIWSRIDWISIKFGQEKNDSNYPGLGTSGGAAVHSPTIASFEI